ncbi:MAG: hypothetical protein AVDCRST_MAG33-964 [uncultured Thermomicrobiales bacterium]|uniref:Uncharacterized protein n=1 Tax=uncultured Thermomicrobiales bacterium TaxID=1645740 RepID=A0A6J4UMW0_9BACT|nr:MAG: hypothetical protein AVDCRST_MAG33-964 [uncultured Thermomicrobiales bacterium]
MAARVIAHDRSRRIDRYGHDQNRDGQYISKDAGWPPVCSGAIV